jgi:hypothetical protein
VLIGKAMPINKNIPAGIYIPDVTSCFPVIAGLQWLIVWLICHADRLGSSQIVGELGQGKFLGIGSLPFLI